MAYGPGWRKWTIGVFFGRLAVLTHCRAILDGTYTAEMNQRYLRKRDRKELFAKAKFPNFFPEVEF